MQALELQQAAGAAKTAKLNAKVRQLEQQLGEHTKMGVDLRRELFGRFGVVADQMGIVEKKFANMEKTLDAKIAEIDSKFDLLHRQLEKAETQLPTDGRMVAEGFNKLTAEVDALKRWSGQIFIQNMGQEPELMWQRGLAHEQSINVLIR